MTYRHTQSRPEPAVAAALGGVALAILAVVVDEPVLFVTAAVLFIIAVIGYALSSLTTQVTPKTIEVAFRWGRPRQVIRHRDVQRVEIVRNTWWYGWGIRWIPGAKMYNVWGLDAVHLELGDMRDFRIGTDDAEGLAAAIEAHTGARR